MQDFGLGLLLVDYGGAYTGYHTYGWQGAIGYGILGAGVGAVAGTALAATYLASPLLVAGMSFVYWGEYLGHGAPWYPTQDEMEKIDDAKKLIRETPGFGWLNIPTTILIADHDKWWGLSPNFAPMCIYLRKDLLELPTVLLASVIVHESTHQYQLPVWKIAWVYLGSDVQKDIPGYGEYHPYEEQSEFLNVHFENKALKKSLTIAEIKQYFPSMSIYYGTFLDDQATSMKNVRSITGNQISDPAVIF